MAKKKTGESVAAAETQAAVAVPTPAEVHDASVAAAAKPLAALHAARMNPLQRNGLNSDDQRRIVRFLAEGAPWPAIKRYFSDISDDALERWKPDLYRMAGE